MAKTNPMEGAQEIQEMLVSYAKQETITPLKKLGRYLGLGLAGSVFMFIGTFFVSLGILRLVQTIDTFAGRSWASALPYLIAIAVLGVFLALIYTALTRAKRRVAS